MLSPTESEQPLYGVTQLFSLFLSFFLCAVFLCFHATDCEACSCRQMDMGSLTCAHISVYIYAHEAAVGANKSAQQALTWRGRKTILRLASQGDHILEVKFCVVPKIVVYNKMGNSF